MATKKSSTSKTARVMNLLSKSREDAPVEQATPAVAEPAAAEQVVQAAPAASEPAPAPVHTAATSPLISSMQADSAISNQVMSALENALDEELSTMQDASTETAPAPAAPVPDPEPAAEAEALVETTPEAEPAVEVPAETASEPAAEEASVEPAAEVVMPAAETVPAPAAEPAPSPVATALANAVAQSEPSEDPAPPTQFKVDSQTTYVNVMEALVEEKANKYIDLFGLCKCHRCVADVKAYALNHLNPKYVVMHTGDVIPRITVYESQFSAVVTAQILNACKIVMSHPRHEQP